MHQLSVAGPLNESYSLALIFKLRLNIRGRSLVNNIYTIKHQRSSSNEPVRRRSWTIITNKCPCPRGARDRGICQLDAIIQDSLFSRTETMWTMLEASRLGRSIDFVAQLQCFQFQLSLACYFEILEHTFP